MIVGDTLKYFKPNRCLNMFVTDMRRLPLLSIQEEEELMLKAKAGDMSAKDKLINGNLRFIFSLAKIYARSEEEVLDYVNEGVLGLEESLKAFDPTRGYKFFTYGVWYIRRQMNYYLMTERDTVSRSAPVGQTAKKVDKIKQRYYAEHGSIPSKEEIKKLLKETFNIEPKNDEFFNDNSTVSIDEEVTDDFSVENSAAFNEITSCMNDYEVKIEREESSHELDVVLSLLNEEEADILKMKYGVYEYENHPCSDEEIAQKYHITVSRVGKIINQIMEYVRQNSKKKAV